MSKHFITGAARSVTNSVERLTELRKNHREWDETDWKESARTRLRTRRSAAPLKQTFPDLSSSRQRDAKEVHPLLLNLSRCWRWSGRRVWFGWRSGHSRALGDCWFIISLRRRIAAGRRFPCG